MNRVLLVAVAATLLALPASAYGHSDLRLRGTVTATNAADHRVTVTSSRLVHFLRVPGSLVRVRIGQRVELRGTTLREQGNGSRVLARGVLIVGSEPRAGNEDDARVEVHGRISSLSPLTVAGVTCAVPAGLSTTGFAVGERVQMTCVLVSNVLTLRRLKSEQANRAEDQDDDEDEDDDDDDEDEDDEDEDDDGGGHRGRG
jgi:hypothetical protein